MSEGSGWAAGAAGGSDASSRGAGSAGSADDGAGVGAGTGVGVGRGAGAGRGAGCVGAGFTLAGLKTTTAVGRAWPPTRAAASAGERRCATTAWCGDERWTGADTAGR